MALYHGWDRDAMLDGRPGDNADSHSEFLLPSSFTAINQAPTSAQPLTPQPTASSSAQTHREPPPKTWPRKRNRAVAEYLGLGAGRETLLFGDDVVAPLEPAQKPRRARAKTANRSAQDTKDANQRRISDGLCATKPSSRRLLTPKDTQDGAFEAASVPEPYPDLSVVLSSATTNKLNAFRYEASLSDTSTADCFTNIAVTATRPFAQAADRVLVAKPSIYNISPEGPATEEDVEGSQPRRASVKGTSKSSRKNLHIASVEPRKRKKSLPEDVDLDDDPLTGQNSMHVPSPICAEAELFDEDMDDIFSSLDLDLLTNHHYSSKHAAREASIITIPDDEPDATLFDPDPFDEGLDDDDLLLLTSDITGSNEAIPYNEGIYTSSDNRWQYSPTRQTDSRPSTAVSSAATIPNRGPSSQFVSPVTDRTLTRSQGVEAERKPIVRPRFPQQTRDRSPIIGLSSNTLLRTCFRIGEAINTGCQAVKNGKNVVLELYARVLTSKRDDKKQHFVFCDLYHRKPPYIKAVYDAAIWKPVELFNFDSGLLLQENRMCRCIGKMRRDGKAWELVVLNIWPTTWEDIEWVEGIVNA